MLNIGIYILHLGSCQEPEHSFWAGIRAQRKHQVLELLISNEVGMHLLLSASHLRTKTQY